MFRSLASFALLMGLAATGCDDAPPPAKKSEEKSEAAAGTDGAAEPEPAPAPEPEPAYEEEDPNAPPPKVVQAKADLTDELRKHAARIETERLALAKRNASLNDLESELQSRLDKITALEQRLQLQLGLGRVAKERREERIGTLADLLATMPPQAGAKIMAQMSDIDAQSLLLAISHKSDRKAAKMLAQMPPERAAQLGQLYLDIERPPPGAEHLGPPEQSPPEAKNTAPAEGAEVEAQGPEGQEKAAGKTSPAGAEQASGKAAHKDTHQDTPPKPEEKH